MNNLPTSHFTEKGTLLPLMNLKGKLYLEVKYRILWFHEKYPEGCITTELVSHDIENGTATFKAIVTNPSSPTKIMKVSIGHGMETKSNFRAYFQKAETIAIGRALAHFGIGTTQALELEETPEDTLADAPVERTTKVDKTNKISSTEILTSVSKGEETWQKEQEKSLKELKAQARAFAKEKKWSPKELKKLVSLVNPEGEIRTAEEYTQLISFLSFGPGQFELSTRESHND